MAQPGLKLEAVIGASGRPNALLLLANGVVVHALGSSVALRKEGSAAAELLQGHSHDVTCLAVSPCGRYLASGEEVPLGFVAEVLVWNLCSRTLLHRLRLHRVSVQALGFSPCSKFLASLGGADDGSLSVWDVASGTGICAALAHNCPAAAVSFFNRSSTRLATGGKQHLRLWEINFAIRKLVPSDVALGQVRRDVTALAIDPSDRILYAASTSGDVLQVNLERGLLRNSGPAKPAQHKGIATLVLLPEENQVVLGAGDGTLAVLAVDTDLMADPKTLPRFKTVTTAAISEHGLTNLVLVGGGGGRLTFLCITAGSELYRVTYMPGSGAISTELLQTAHPGGVRDVAFPAAFSVVFATCSGSEVRVWQVAPAKQLLAVAGPRGVQCRCVAFAADGKSILSGWSDGRIRAYGPQSGKLLYAINDAHPKGVTAIASSPDSASIISGGEDGCVRVWRIGRESQTLVQSMKEQAAAINAIRLSPDGRHFATASSDCSTILWDSATCRRATQLLENISVRAVCWHPQGAELVTTGGTHLTYYDAHNGSTLRALEVGEGAVSSVALDASGEVLVTGGSDQLVKLWRFAEGQPLAEGRGHSGQVERVRFSPDGKTVVSVGGEGAICVWSTKAP